jgi:hypothetical protein
MLSEAQKRANLKWKNANPERIREITRNISHRFYLNHKEKRKGQSRDYYYANIAIIKAVNKAKYCYRKEWELFRNILLE